MTETMHMSDENCDCAEHGLQPITFVCTHIVGSASPETPGFVSFASEDEHDLRDAWCEACDAYLQENGGEWVEGDVEVPGGIAIICAECYRHRETDARIAGRRAIRHG